MIATVRAHLEEEGLIPQEESVSTSDADSNSDTPQVKATSVASGTRSSLRDQLREIEGPEYQLDEESDHPLSIPQLANEAEAEIPIAASSSAVVVSEAEAEASNVNKGKGIMTDEDEERKIPAVDRIEEDADLALQLQEQFNKEEEELEKKKKEEAKFRITDSELAKETREEWVKTLVSQGEDADYLEKHSTKEIYRAFMGQQGQLARKKKAEEEEKAKLQPEEIVERG
ncbi:hypothetical protein L1987_20386 [Smallanthus sonchifolius]|uniref:Uncharacterized protein n=1 Tax=Smallanthus sonchifolius TaxID=185202 RepID=A0ACB9IRX0_9ASTR|nr:hypothetical protein L1987_20386 [Smallanthus sonchifolius]